jgi:hypothetical protein
MNYLKEKKTSISLVAKEKRRKKKKKKKAEDIIRTYIPFWVVEALAFSHILKERSKLMSFGYQLRLSKE